MDNLQSKLITKQSTISGRNQTVVPAEIRRHIKAGPGDKLVWRTLGLKDSSKVVVEPQSPSVATKMRGLGESLWKDTNIDDYIQNLRAEW